MTDIDPHLPIRPRAAGQAIDRLFDDAFSSHGDGFNRTTLFGWKPVSDLFMDERRRFNGWEGLEEGCFRQDPTAPDLSPHVSIEETPASIFITVDLPGLVNDSVRVEVRGNILTLSGEQRLPLPLPAATAVDERQRAFRRAFTLPRTVRRGEVRARLQGNGVRIDIAKA